jgi:hypothetical protein
MRGEQGVRLFVRRTGAAGRARGGEERVCDLTLG